MACAAHGAAQGSDKIGAALQGAGRLRATDMPELLFKGKEYVYNQHLTAPYRPLVADAARSVGPASLDGNLIIHGDNLHALKALLPRCAGQVDLVFIDPPFNTGNEGWCYSDNLRAQYGLQGWQRDKVYPDFVFAHATRDGSDCLVVMETKGLHLANSDDTQYKQRLFEALTRMHAQTPQLQRAGELTLQSSTGMRLVCDLVVEPGWQGQVAARYFGVPADGAVT